MKKILFAALSATVFTAAFGGPTISQADYQASYAKASALADKALAMHAGWTVTEKTLKQAQQAAADQDFDQAVVLAQQAGALAQASIRQSVEQQTAWRAAVIK
jgi:excinuclease UvrABC nuclease subunit